jgi:hypothetical protein
MKKREKDALRNMDGKLLNAVEELHCWEVKYKGNF